MKKVIRLTESDLTKIVKKVLMESQEEIKTLGGSTSTSKMDKTTVKNIVNKAKSTWGSCFDSRKYPQLTAYAEVLKDGIETLILIVVGIVLSEIGVGTVLIAWGTGMGAVTLMDLMVALKSERSVSKELGRLKTCIYKNISSYI